MEALSLQKPAVSKPVSWAALARQGLPEPPNPEPTTAAAPSQPAPLQQALSQQAPSQQAPSQPHAPAAAAARVPVEGEWTPPEPRGIINRKNECFINSVLQVLVTCQPLAAAVMSTASQSAGCLATTQDFLQAYTSGKDALEPEAHVHPFLGLFRPNGHGSTQEDAQEFMAFLLDQLHEQTLHAPAAEPDESKDEWLEVGKRNRSAVMQQRAEQLKESAMSAVASCVVRSALKRRGASMESASRERLFMLPLEIAHSRIDHVEDAIQAFMCKETIEGVQSNRGKVVAAKHNELDSVPQVLMLQLKRFTFGQKGAEKLGKRLEFDMDLELSAQHMSSALQLSLGKEAARYRLQGVVSHHGKRMGDGHYTCDGCVQDKWFRFDDRSVKPISPEQVLNQQAYILVYQRI